MATRRIERLNEQIRREVSSLLLTEVRDPRVGGVSVVDVEVAPDLGSARVWVRASGTDVDRAASLEGLQAAAPFLRRTLGKALRVRRIPELRFHEDHSMEHGLRIEQILSEVLPEPETPSERIEREARARGEEKAPGSG